MQYVTLGTVSALLALAAMGASLFGKAQLAAFFTDPSTAQAVLNAISASLILVAGFAKGVKQKAVEIAAKPAI